MIVVLVISNVRDILSQLKILFQKKDLKDRRSGLFFLAVRMYKVFPRSHEKYLVSCPPVSHKWGFPRDLYRSKGNSQRYLPVKYFAPKPPSSNARASQSQNTFFREIGICAEKCVQRVIPTLDRKTVDILLKALQITYPTQKSDPKSVKRFPSYCPKTLPFFARSAGNHFPKSALNALIHLLLSPNCQERCIQHMHTFCCRKKMIT